MPPRIRERLRRANPQLLMFLLAVIFLGASGGVFESTFNNFLRDTFHLSPDVRGQLEFPRELPGFLVAVLAGALFFLPEVRMAAVAALVWAIGLIGLATTGHRWRPMVLSMFLQSMGAHTWMPLNSTIGLSLAREGRHGARLGQVAGVGTASTIIGAAIVWIGTKGLHLPYQTLFWISGIGVVCAIASSSVCTPPPASRSGAGHSCSSAATGFCTFSPCSSARGSRCSLRSRRGCW